VLVGLRLRAENIGGALFFTFGQIVGISEVFMGYAYQSTDRQLLREWG